MYIYLTRRSVGPSRPAGQRRDEFDRALLSLVAARLVARVMHFLIPIRQED